VQKFSEVSFIYVAMSSLRLHFMGVFLTIWEGKLMEVFLKTTDVFTIDPLKESFQERLLLDWLRSVFKYFGVNF